MSDFKVGDVGLSTYGRVLNTDQGWMFDDGSGYVKDAGDLSGFRPLVVLDPEDREQVERLADALVGAMCKSDPDWDRARAYEVRGHMAAALREFANPTPPKPEEPTGDGAVVEDERGCRWVRIAAQGETSDSPPWRHRGHTARRWDHVNAVRVLSEGVTP